MTNYHKSRTAFVKECEKLIKHLNKRIAKLEYLYTPIEIVKVTYRDTNVSDFIHIEYCETLYDIVVELFTAMKYR